MAADLRIAITFWFSKYQPLLHPNHFMIGYHKIVADYIQQERYDESIVPEHFESIFQKHLSRKKKHEIDVLSKVGACFV